MSTNRSNDDDLDALADHLRGLPVPPVPTGLEAKLLAAIPDTRAVMPRPRGRLLAFAGVGGALAAAVVLVVLFGHPFGKTDDLHVAVSLPTRPLPVTDRDFRLADPRPGLAAAPFEWPVQLTAPVAHHLPDDLTD